MFLIGSADRSPDRYWPTTVNLVGAAYDRITALAGDGVGDFEYRPIDVPSDMYGKLLQKQRPFSMDAYYALGGALIKQGDNEKSNDVLFAGKVVERKEMWAESKLAWMQSLVLSSLVGYGYRLHRVLYWIVGIVVVGAFVFRSTPEARETGMPYGLAFSFDMLLPIVTLRKRHHDIDITGWQWYYFYAHKLAGYVLAAFVAAAVAGVAK